MPQPISQQESEERVNIYKTSYLFSLAQECYDSRFLMNNVKRFLERLQIYDREVTPDEICELQKIEELVIKKKIKVEEKQKRLKNSIYVRIILFFIAMIVLEITFIYRRSAYQKTITLTMGVAASVTFLNSTYPNFWLIFSRNRKQEEEKEDVKEPITTMKSSELIQRQLQLVDIMSEVVEPLKRKNRVLQFNVRLLDFVYIMGPIYYYLILIVG